MKTDRRLVTDAEAAEIRREYIGATTGEETVRALLDTREELIAALERAHNHLRFNSWKDDPNADKRFRAVEEARAILAQVRDES
jgi:hypothetical protein